MTLTKKSRLHRMGRVAAVFLAGAVAAGGICGGAGISAAATPDAPSTVSSDSPPGGEATWSVMNRTGEPVWGYLEIQRGSTGSRIGWPKDAPVPSGAGDSAPRTGWGVLYTQGRICYHGAWWNLPRDNYGSGSYDDVYNWNLVAADNDRNTLTVADAEHRYIKPMPMIRTPGDSECVSIPGTSSLDSE
ncbi:hypothetical protein R3Q06_34305 [Rhodococcus erythropolis]|uniref:hypothetical protein n=1 Tax=Rhodococcus erythropolis TaxID=1833 RepID=UPI00294A575B|nr:hypothetical protein [Rhodococcus erythropolis]MDV6278483.1 hypothetical protein [Rhodococcus erythropolis]